MKFSAIAVLLIIIVSCSSFTTLEGGLEQKKGYTCSDGKSVPRIFSGTNNSIRVLAQSPIYFAPLILLDTLWSAYADLLFVGITIPTQITRGNMCILENFNKEEKDTDLEVQEQ